MNHRYVLRRDWGFGTGRGSVNFIMLNPSTADDLFDDPTIRRCIGYAKRWGFDSLVVTNLFAYRATDPKELLKITKTDLPLAIGKESGYYLESEAAAASIIVCAWGDNCDAIPHRALNVIASLREYDLFCIRKTAKGNPAHPVREPYTDEPMLYFSKLSTEVEAIPGEPCTCDLENPAMVCPKHPGGLR
jgi:hypothetical protein